MPIPREIKRLWYGWDWQKKIRPAVLKRAGYCCERCHRPWKPLDVAHLDGDYTNRRPENLAALCRPHHRANDKDQWAARCRETRARRKDRSRPLLMETA